LGDLALKWDAGRTAQALARICEPARPHHLWPTKPDQAADQGLWPLQSGSKPRNRPTDATSQGSGLG
jgi:hypothetical protein